jgi:hypothetical protein
VPCLRHHPHACLREGPVGTRKDRLGGVLKNRPSLPRLVRLMLPERVFSVGGGLSIATGALLALAGTFEGSLVLVSILPAAIFLIGFGAFFLYVGSGAKRARQRLLDSPRPTADAAPPGKRS